MRTRLIAAGVGAALVTVSPSDSASVLRAARNAAPRESRIPIGHASLYARDIGRGQPIIVLHGGPDFDHSYLLPDLDRLSDAFRLIYYDQRGRGQSADHVQPEEVTLASEVADLDEVRRHFLLESSAVLGHSWGAVLALEYALRHATRVSHLILMNPAPASASDLAVFRKAYTEQLGADMGSPKGDRGQRRLQRRRPRGRRCALSSSLQARPCATRGLREADGDDDGCIRQPGQNGHREGASGRGRADARYVARGRLRSPAQAANREHSNVGHHW
jgi:pimeloyl-ACP methyl ester carboxylesterase